MFGTGHHSDKFSKKAFEDILELGITRNDLLNSFGLSLIHHNDLDGTTELYRYSE